MKLISPEEAALSGAFSPDEISELSTGSRRAHVKDILAQGLALDSSLTFLAFMSAFAFIQLTRVYPGRATVALVNAEVPERDGFYRRKAGEEHLFHADSEDYEGMAGAHEEEAVILAQAMLSGGINVGQAFSMLPMSAYCKVTLTGTARDAYDLYRAIGKRPGLFHPDARTAAIDLVAGWQQYAPSIMAALKETT
jgi:hypothetical protein